MIRSTCAQLVGKRKRLGELVFVELLHGVVKVLCHRLGSIRKPLASSGCGRKAQGACRSARAMSQSCALRAATMVRSQACDTCHRRFVKVDQPRDVARACRAATSRSPLGLGADHLEVICHDEHARAHVTGAPELVSVARKVKRSFSVSRLPSAAPLHCRRRHSRTS